MRARSSDHLSLQPSCGDILGSASVTAREIEAIERARDRIDGEITFAIDALRVAICVRRPRPGQLVRRRRGQEVLARRVAGDSAPTRGLRRHERRPDSRIPHKSAIHGRIGRANPRARCVVRQAAIGDTAIGDRRDGAIEACPWRSGGARRIPGATGRQREKSRHEGDSERQRSDGFIAAEHPSCLCIEQAVYVDERVRASNSRRSCRGLSAVEEPLDLLARCWSSAAPA